MAENFDSHSMERKLKIEERVENCLQQKTGNLAVNLSEAKSQYKQLKRILQHLQAKQLLLENVRTSEKADDEDIKRRLQECSRNNAERNGEIEQRSRSITDMAEHVQRKLGEVKTKRAAVADLREEVTGKKLKLEEKENEIKSLGTVQSAQNMLADSEGILKTVDLQLKTVQSLEEKRHAELRKLRHEQERMNERLDAIRRELSAKEMLLQEKKANTECERTQDLINEISTLQGVKIVSVSNTDVILQISNPDVTVGGGETGQLELAVSYLEDKHGHLKIAGAKVNVYSLNIEELVAEAVRTGSLKTLVHRVTQQWLKSYRLLDEVEHLREKFALDWLPDKGHVTVLYEDVMCTLSISADYPEHGSVRLDKVSGSLDKASATNFPEPEKRSPRLTDWLHHLHTLFTKDFVKQTDS